MYILYFIFILILFLSVSIEYFGVLVCMFGWIIVYLIVQY